MYCTNLWVITYALKTTITVRVNLEVISAVNFDFFVNSVDE